MRLVLALAIVLLAGCGKPNTIVGKWRLETGTAAAPVPSGDKSGITELIMNRDGTLMQMVYAENATAKNEQYSGHYRLVGDEIIMTVNFGPNKTKRLKGRKQPGKITFDDGSTYVKE